MNVTLFGNRVFAGVIKLRCNPTGLEGALIQRLGNLIKDTGTQGEGHVKTEQRLDDVSTSQGMPRIASSHQKLGRGLEQILSQSLQKEPTC